MLRFLFLLFSNLLFSVSEDDLTDLEAIDYFKSFGYINNANSFITPDAFENAIKDFQKFGGLEETGVMDSRTRKLLKAPRCGLGDKRDKVANFVTRGKWRKNHLTYRIFEYPSTRSLSRRDVDDETRKAFNMWQEVSGLSFSEKSSGPVDIEIIFASGSHGDGSPFNGRGGVLAHAYFPGQGAISGDAHFDDAEPWSVTPFVGNHMLNTLTHEFGHSIGLSHSNVPGAIMAPFYKGWDVNLRLADDDIQGVQSLYGRNTGNPPVGPGPDPPTGTPTEPKRPPRDKKLCRSIIDAFVRTSDDNTYVFSGSEYYKLTNDDTDVADGYPRSISQYWPGLPNNIDAAVTWKDEGVTYFFKGSRYWRYSGTTPSSGYPKDISNWGGLPSGIDAAFQWGEDNHLYFFRGSQYWKYDTDETEMARGYPRNIANNWNGIPNNIDAAYQWKNGKTYFFKSKNYWRLNDENKSVSDANPPYPRKSGKWWFNCPKRKKTIPLLDDNYEYDFEQ